LLSLTQLSLFRCGIDNKGVTALSKALAARTDIKDENGIVKDQLPLIQLDLGGNRDITDKGVVSLFPILSQLKALDLQETSCSLGCMQQLFGLLRTNISLSSIRFPSLTNKGKLPRHVVDHCFAINTSLTDCFDIGDEVPWFCELNKFSNKLHASKQVRDSVPRKTNIPHIEPSLEELINSSKEWRSLKLVVLGNKCIGKTTLLHALLDIMGTTKLDKGAIASTIGIDCSTIRLAGGDISVWDFGSQLEQTHQFFLSSEV
jgi:hypothetical protein